MIIVGLDPGYDRLGVAVLEKTTAGEKLIYSDCLVSDRKMTRPERLADLGRKLEQILKKYRPELVALEQLFFAKNQKTALGVAEARGVINYLAVRSGAAVRELSPASVKLAITGYGRADKRQVSEMLRRLLKIEKKIKYDDESDAIAVALAMLSTVRLK